MKLLLAEDNRFFRGLLESHLSKWGYEVTSCEDGKQALKILQNHEPPDLALLGWDLPGMKAVDICSRMRKHPGERHIHVILLVPADHKEDLQEGLDAGADDYLMKPFEPVELQMRLRTARNTMRLREKLPFWLGLANASEDPDPAILGRSRILDVLSNEIARSERQRTPVGIIIVDVLSEGDHAHGHETTGVKTLAQRIGLRLRSELRLYDSIGTYGEGIFLIVAPGCDKDTAKKVASRLKKSMRTLLQSSGPAGASAKVRFGVTGLVGEGSAGLDVVVRAADEALSRARESPPISHDDSGPVTHSLHK